MPNRLPLLLVGDAPNLPTGLARIARDLAYRITKHLPEIELAWLGWDFRDFEKWPWQNYCISDHENWGMKDLPLTWWKAFGKRPGVVMTVWDPARCFALLEESEQVPAQLWGYFPLDGVNINGSLGGPAAAAVRKYRRVLGYGEFGADVLGNILGGGEVSWLPHGLDLSTWFPRRPTENLVGVVATNTPRKDWGLAFQAFRAMKQAMPRLKLWCHISKEVTSAWSLPELADQCAIAPEDLIVTGVGEGISGSIPDDHLANLYSACVVTLAPGLGEGFGYPIVESLACGRPVIHADYAGGAALVPEASWRVKPKMFHVESAYALKRPMVEPGDFADAALGAAEWMLREPQVVAAYCQGSVRHLGWDSLWPRWEAWFRQGMGELL